MNILRKVIREILIENASHEDKLAAMIGTLDLENVRQGFELAETLGIVDEYEEYNVMYGGLDRFSFNALVKRSFAKKLEDAIKTSPNSQRLSFFMNDTNNELLQYGEDDLPPFTMITFRMVEN